MRLQTLSYRSDRGLSRSIDATLDSSSTLVLAFGASRGDLRHALRMVREQLPLSHMIGCSTAGEILGSEVSDDSLSIAIARFERSRVRSTIALAIDSSDSFAIGQHVGRTLNAPDLRAVFVLADGLNVAGSKLVRGIRSAIGDRPAVTGGLAGDGLLFEKTWVMHQGLLGSGAAVAAGLYGERMEIGFGSKGGWDIFGPERAITRARDNVLYELDGKPALQLYKTYLGQRASGLPATALLFPLALRSDGACESSVVRTVLAVNERDQSMTFAGDIPQGARAQLMRANFDRLVQGASDAAAMTQAGGALLGGPTLSIAVSCVGRRMVLGERTEEETEATLEAMPARTEQVGFYSYGEISPCPHVGSELHNQTMTLTTLSES